AGVDQEPVPDAAGLLAVEAAHVERRRRGEAGAALRHQRHPAVVEIIKGLARRPREERLAGEETQGEEFGERSEHDLRSLALEMEGEGLVAVLAGDVEQVVERL